MNLFLESPQQRYIPSAGDTAVTMGNMFGAEAGMSQQVVPGQSSGGRDAPASGWSVFGGRLEGGRPAPTGGQSALASGQPAPVAGHPAYANGQPAAAGGQPTPDAYRASSYSVTQDDYQKERAFDKRRARNRAIGRVLRVLLLVIAIPLLLIAIFVGSYVLTCILDGATPQEVLELLTVQMARIQSFAAQL